MTYAVIATGGKQYKVELGKTVEVEKLDAEGKEIIFNQVLLLVDGNKVEVGTPSLKDVTVKGEVIELERKDDKIRVFKFKSKSRYRKLRGHRQTHTVVKVTAIGSQVLEASKAVTVSPRSSKSEGVKEVKEAKKVAPKKPTTKKKPVAKK